MFPARTEPIGETVVRGIKEFLFDGFQHGDCFFFCAYGQRDPDEPGTLDFCFETCFGANCSVVIRCHGGSPVDEKCVSNINLFRPSCNDLAPLMPLPYLAPNRRNVQMKIGIVCYPTYGGSGVI